MLSDRTVNQRRNEATREIAETELLLSFCRPCCLERRRLGVSVDGSVRKGWRMAVAQLPRVCRSLLMLTLTML